MALRLRKTCRAYPRFAGYTPRSKEASEIKRRNRARNTSPEILLARELKKRGVRVIPHNRALDGKPDFVLLPNIAIFCDGDFWHGRQWKLRRSKLQSGHNSEYWCRKIEANIKRDRTVNNVLRRAGW